MGELKRRVLKLISGAEGAGPAHAAAPQPRDDRDALGIGAMLRAARIQAGLELRDVATMLKIRHTFMLAIEDGRYSELPGSAYAVGFVRAYADYLGLDSEAVVRRFKDEVAGKVGRQNLYFPTPVPEGKIPGGTVLLFSVILVVLVYGGWYVLSATDRSVVDIVPALPQRLVSLLDVFSHGPAPVKDLGTTTTPAVPPPPLPAETITAPAPPATPAAETAPPPALPGGIVLKGGAAAPGPAPTPAPPGASAPALGADTGDTGDEIPLVSGPADENLSEPGPLVPMAPRVKPARSGAPGETPAASPPPAPTPAPAVVPPVAAPPAPPVAAADPTAGATRVYGGQNRDSRVLIKASQDTWVQVRDASGEAIFTRVLHAGEVFRVPDRAGMRLRTGNAGGLGAIVDGGEAQPLGQVGQVLRDLPIDVAHLRGSTAPRGAEE